MSNPRKVLPPPLPAVPCTLRTFKTMVCKYVSFSLSLTSNLWPRRNSEIYKRARKVRERQFEQWKSDSSYCCLLISDMWKICIVLLVCNGQNLNILSNQVLNSINSLSRHRALLTAFRGASWLAARLGRSRLCQPRRFRALDNWLPKWNWDIFYLTRQTWARAA